MRLILSSSPSEFAQKPDTLVLRRSCNIKSAFDLLIKYQMNKCSEIVIDSHVMSGWEFTSPPEESYHFERAVLDPLYLLSNLLSYNLIEVNASCLWIIDSSGNSPYSSEFIYPVAKGFLKRFQNDMSISSLTVNRGIYRKSPKKLESLIDEALK